MFCKKCGEALPEESLICQACGEDNSPEIVEVPAKRGFPWVAVVSSTLCVVLFVVLAWWIISDVTGLKLGDLFSTKENDVYYKESYTVDADSAFANREQIVATLGEDKLTNGQLQVFYGMQIIDYLNTNGALFDYTKPLDTQMYNKDLGVSWQQFFLEAALNTWKQYRIVTNKAIAAGFKLEAQYQEDLDTTMERLTKVAEEYKFESVDALIQADMGPGCTFEDYMYYMELYYYGELYYRELSGKLEVTEEEMEAYFVANEEDLATNGITKDSGLLVDVRQILVKPSGTTKGPDGSTIVYSEDEFEACREKIQEILDIWLAGEKTAESFAKLAAEKSQDKNTAENGGLYAYLSEGALNIVDVRHILLMPEGGTLSDDGKTTVYSEEEWEACYNKAKDVLDTFLAGEQTEERFGELAKEHTKDGNGSVGGIYMNVPKNYMVKPFEEWIFDESREYGDTDIVKTQFGYHVMFFVDRDDAVDNWIFAEGRKAGDYEIVKADDGWHLVYYVDGEEGWKRLSRAGVMDEKSTDLLQDLIVGYELEADYKNIVLGQAEL